MERQTRQMGPNYTPAISKGKSFPIPPTRVMSTSKQNKPNQPQDFSFFEEGRCCPNSESDPRDHLTCGLGPSHEARVDPGGQT